MLLTVNAKQLWSV